MHFFYKNDFFNQHFAFLLFWLKCEYKTNFTLLKKSCEGFISNHFSPKKLVYVNAILQILTLVLFYRSVVATHIGLGFLMVVLKLAAKTK